MGWYQLFGDALEINLQPDWWARANTRSQELAQRGQVDLQTNRFWTGIELSNHGMICEAAFAKHLGVPCLWELADHGLTGRPDVDLYEVKSSAWHNVTAFADWKGGNTWVPQHTQAKALAVLTVFRATREHMVHLDGWMPMDEVRTFPVVPGKGGKGLSHQVPYDALHSWRTM